MAHRGYLWAKKELRRMTMSEPFQSIRSGGVKVVRSTSYRSCWGVAAGQWVAPYGCQKAAESYAEKLHGYIAAYRGEMSKRSDYKPVDDRIGKAVSTARATLNDMMPSKSAGVFVSCGGDVGVNRSGRQPHITIPYTWEAKVHSQNIHWTEAGGKPAFTISASRKTSTFLAEDGIIAFDAKVYLPRSMRVMDGFIFKADGLDFCLFHDDFRLGANLIRRRVRNAVLKELMTEV